MIFLGKKLQFFILNMCLIDVSLLFQMHANSSKLAQHNSPWEKIEKQKNLHFSQSSVHLSTRHYTSHSPSLSLSFSCYTLPSLSCSYAVCSWNPSAIDRSIKRLQFAVPSPDARQVSPQVPRLGHKTNVCLPVYLCVSVCVYVWVCEGVCATTIGSSLQCIHLSSATSSAVWDCCRPVCPLSLTHSASRPLSLIYHLCGSKKFSIIWASGGRKCVKSRRKAGAKKGWQMIAQTFGKSAMRFP